MGLIELEHVSFSYDGEERKVLSDVSLSIEKGTFLSVIGHNGSGKSTFSRLLNGLLIPTSGKVLVDGLDTANKKNLKEIRRQVGVVFQNPDNQIVSDTVEEDTAFAPENLGLGRKEISERVERSLSSVGLLDKRYDNPNELSGGEKARLSLAGILAMDPEVLVLDEVTAMLDPEGRERIMEILVDLKTQGKTIIFITHHTEETLSSDRLIVFKDGLPIKDGKPREIYSDPKDDTIPLPFASRLNLKLKEKGIDIFDGAVTLSDLGGGLC